MAEENATTTEAATEELIASTVEAPEAGPAEETRPLAPAAKPDRGGFIWGTGRRKAAVARVRIRPVPEGGEPKFLVNGRDADTYFTEIRDRNDIRLPMEVTSTQGNFEVYVNATGGGFTGQAGAVKLGLARALKGYDPSLESALRDNELLSRDPRRVERKKYGQPGARKRFQFSKR